MSDSVKAVVSKREIKLIPDIANESADRTANNENQFDITVVNESSKFASFYIELSAIGADAESNVKWYSLEPNVSTKKPPGARTTFHVIVTKPPIPVYDATIELTLKVFSVEYPNIYNSQKINLIVEKARKPLRLELPIKEFKVLPGEKKEILVRVHNYSQKAAEVKLTISGLDAEWMIQGTEKKLQIDAGEYQQTSFWCQPTENTRDISGKYNFDIEAKSDTTNYTTPKEEGVLELLPQGNVEFICKNKLQKIPVLKVKGAKKQFKFATYELEFTNNSNLSQEINLKISESDVRQWGLKIPAPIELAPGESKPIYLVAKKRRPWWWLKQRLLFEVSPILTNPDTAEPDPQIRSNPNTRVLELQILPIIPFWLQLLGLLLLLLLVWLLWYLNPQDYHQGPVHSVRLIGNGGLVVSGSSDQTIRLWQVDRNPWQLDARRLKYEGFIAEKTEKSVRVIHQSPREDYIIASGLESGDIKLWNVLSKKEPRSIYQGTDRVFALTFSKDSRYLFSGHGSGVVRKWYLDAPQIKPQIADSRFTIYALAISESRQKPNVLVAIAGRYNKLSLWDWFNRRIYELEYVGQDGQEDKNFSPIVGQNQYIDSLAIADSKNLLAASDNQGYISLWDMDSIRQCINNSAAALANNSEIGQPKTDAYGNIIISLDCDDAILDRWHQGNNNPPVRSVALSQNGCYLASGGDDGRVVLWPLENRKRSSQYRDGKIIAEFQGVRLNSVDIKALDDNLLIATGDDKNRVRLYRVNGSDENNNAKCQ
ncbi:hypothetical protein [Microcoleus sp. D2_18a_D3]|uniref:hypothetical protein n=1 Tax=Microcoleus sp. D2_18a_D3 TaxID=3055330 RepID=UPI002FCF8C80